MDFSNKKNDSLSRIDWFDDFDGDNEFRFLSNFYIGEPIAYDHSEFQTGEHLFAALKANNRVDFERARTSSNPGRAKHVGRTLDLRPDWERVKYDVMRYVLALKFTTERHEGMLLVHTDDEMLVEGTDWNDKVWGVNREKGIGRNWLGVLLMARRAELRAEERGAEEFDYSETARFIKANWRGKREGNPK